MMMELNLVEAVTSGEKIDTSFTEERRMFDAERRSEICQNVAGRVRQLRCGGKLSDIKNAKFCQSIYSRQQKSRRVICLP